MLFAHMYYNTIIIIIIIISIIIIIIIGGRYNYMGNCRRISACRNNYPLYIYFINIIIYL